MQPKPDFILSDITMPQMNGFEFMEQVRAHPEFVGIPALAVSTILDKDEILRASKVGFNEYEIKINKDSLLDKIQTLIEVMESTLIPLVNRRTAEKVSEYKESIQLISLNGIVFASKLGRRGAALAPIFDHTTKTGDFATSQMEKLLREMASSEFEQTLYALETFSKQAIDLIDRNLFERTADVRWWATDTFFHSALQDATDQAFEKALDSLRVINSSYTMYNDLLLIDDEGRVVANARGELRNDYRRLDVSNRGWFKEVMRSGDSAFYISSDVKKSVLQPDKASSLIYAAGVRENGARQGLAKGALATLFDWSKEARSILNSCLHRDADGHVVEASVAFYTNRNREVIETTDERLFPLGATIELPVEHKNLQPGQANAGCLEQNGVRYLIGSARTKGYRENPGLDWMGHVVRPL